MLSKIGAKLPTRISSRLLTSKDSSSKRTKSKRWRPPSSFPNCNRSTSWCKWEVRTKMELSLKKRKISFQFSTVFKAVLEPKSVWVEVCLKFKLLTWRMSNPGTYIPWWLCPSKIIPSVKAFILCCCSTLTTFLWLNLKKLSANAS